MKNNVATLLDVFENEMHQISGKFAKMEDLRSSVELQISEFKQICKRKHTMTDSDLQAMVIDFKQEGEDAIVISISKYALSVLDGNFIPHAIFTSSISGNTLIHPITNKETLLSNRYIKIKLLKSDEDNW